jgi:hypothetical protein
MDDYPKVKVTGAPGREDFEGVLIIDRPDDWPVDVCVVGFEWEGERDIAAVPRSCVTLINENGS